jgi:hypothetical protein
MINYYFFQFIKKNGPDRTVDRSVGVWSPKANGETDSIFSNMDRLEPTYVDRSGPWTVNHPNLNRTEPDRFSNLELHLTKPKPVGTFQDVLSRSLSFFILKRTLDQQWSMCFMDVVWQNFPRGLENRVGPFDWCVASVRKIGRTCLDWMLN